MWLCDFSLAVPQQPLVGGDKGGVVVRAKSGV